MVERDVQLLICHEPTFWDHLHDAPKDDAMSQDKLRCINEHLGLQAEHYPHGNSFRLVGGTA